MERRVLASNPHRQPKASEAAHKGELHPRYAFTIAAFIGWPGGERRERL